MKPAAILLAAGFSRRLGRPKQGVLLAGEPLLLRAARTALTAGLLPVIAVVQDSSWQGPLASLGVELILNPDAREGMGSSVRAGVQAIAERRLPGVVILTCDQPLLTSAHLQSLFTEPMRVTGSRYGGRMGVPAYFPRDVFPALLKLHGDAGARALLQGAAAVENEDLALDIDTEADVARALELVQQKGS